MTIFSSRQTTDATPSKWPGPARAAELAGERRQRDAHRVLEPERVDLAHVGREQQVDGAGRVETRRCRRRACADKRRSLRSVRTASDSRRCSRRRGRTRPRREPRGSCGRRADCPSSARTRRSRPPRASDARRRERRPHVRTVMSACVLIDDERAFAAHQGMRSIKPRKCASRPDSCGLSRRSRTRAAPRAPSRGRP